MLSLKVCAFCMGVVPPTFFRRSISDHAKLSPTPMGDHVQLFRDHAELHAEMLANHPHGGYGVSIITPPLLIKHVADPACFLLGIY